MWSDEKPLKQWSGRLKLAFLIICGFATWGAVAGAAYLVARLAT